jgi:putative aminopeptidase FrvX
MIAGDDIMEVNSERMAAFLKRIAETPSPSGNTSRVMEIVSGEFDKLGIPYFFTPKGTLIASIRGKNNDTQRTLSAHVDTLGAMVKEVKSSGRLSISPIGGYMGQSVEGAGCIIQTISGREYTGTIHTIKPSVHIHSDAKDLDRKIENYEIVIDEKVFTREDSLSLGIDVGDFVFIDPRTVITESGFIKSRHLDDKAGVAVLLEAAQCLLQSGETPPFTTNFFISAYEEVGHGASASIPSGTVEFISVDMGAPGEGQNSTEYSVSICAKDSTGPYDLGLKKKLVELCKASGIDYRIDIYPHYGSDASAALQSGWDMRTALIGPGIFASHAYERTHKDALINTVKLVVSYILDQSI